MWWLTDARDAHVVDPLRRTMLMNYFRLIKNIIIFFSLLIGLEE